MKPWCAVCAEVAIIYPSDTPSKGENNMQQLEIDEAKTRLSELARKAAGGESFVIADSGKPLAKIVGYERNGTSKRSELFGCMRDKGYVAKDLDFKAFCREEIAEMFGLETADQ
jgi:antitoxin (DNA-binding transcriptional repressor) of toxin-antitoxin stability system